MWRFADVCGEIDLVLLDGAGSLYLPELKCLLAENAFARDYLDRVRNPSKGYGADIQGERPVTRQ